jgi:uncharacterized membrane protein YphA (DoxX/SURF4 family)
MIQSLHGAITRALSCREVVRSPKLLSSTAPASVILIGVIVGWVLLSEGIQKFLFPAALGVGRFTKIGIRHPQILAPFVGVCEIPLGALLIIGLFTRLATIPLLCVISLAIWTTKTSMRSQQGFWVHEARRDFCMVFGLFFLLVGGAGRLSLDARIQGSALIRRAFPNFRSLRGPIRRHADRNGMA